MKAMNLKQQLKAYLKLRDLTAAELSRRTGVPRQSLSNWLAGLPPRRIDYIKAISDELGTSLDNLLYGVSTEASTLPTEIVEKTEVTPGRYEIVVRRISE